MAYIKTLKRIVNIAADDKWIEANPSSKFVCTSKETARTELEDHELLLLEQKTLNIARLEEVEDCYLFPAIQVMPLRMLVNLSPSI